MKTGREDKFMCDCEKLLKELEEQEKTLQFSEFTNETALEIGLALIEKAKKEDKKIAVNITRNGQQLFHYAFEGTAPDNDQWIAKKNNVVYRFSRSSLYIGTFLKIEGKSIEEKFHISSFEFFPFGGAFPIIVKNVGVIGTITVSNLAPEEDHKMVIEAIGEYLKL